MREEKKWGRASLASTGESFTPKKRVKLEPRKIEKN